MLNGNSREGLPKRKIFNNERTVQPLCSTKRYKIFLPWRRVGGGIFYFDAGFIAIATT